MNRIGARCLAGLALTAACSFALDPRQAVESYLRTTFTREDDISLNVVNAVVQSRDGFLWIGCFCGLIRFDGRRFSLVDLAPGRSLYVRAMAESPTGDLWLGTDEGMLRIPQTALRDPGPDSFTRYPLGEERSSSVAALRITRDGTLWAGTQSGLFRFDGKAFTPVIRDIPVYRIEEMLDGHLMVISESGVLEWDGTRAVNHPEIPAELGITTNQIFQVFQDRSGAVWFCTSQGLFRRAAGSVQRFRQPGPGKAAYEVYQDREGNIWVSMDNGVFRARDRTLEAVAPDVRARVFCADRDGSLWIGTNGTGLMQLKNPAVHMFTKADGLPNDVIMTVLTTRSGKLWAGANCGGLAWFDGARFHTLIDQHKLAGCVYALAEDNNSDLWVGTYHGGLFRVHDGQFTQYSKAQGLPSDIVTSIQFTRDGSLWASTPSGLVRMQDGRIRTYTTADGLQDNHVRNVVEDRSGTIWVATRRGIYRLSGNRFVPVAAGETMDIFRVLIDDRTGNLYATTTRGVSQLDSRGLGEPIPGLHGWSMAALSEDFWFAGDGVYRVAAASVRKWEQDRDGPLDYTTVTQADGLRTLECSTGSPGIAITPDGRLWIATVQGLAAIDVPNLPRAREKPLVYLSHVTVGRTSESAGRALNLRPGTSHVELQFDSVELQSPEKIRFQYRLDGVDETWLDGATNRTAIYSSIPAGTHVFHVRATDRDGRWDRAGILYAVTQQPYYYQTAWFRAGCAALLLTGIWLVYRLRLRQVAAAMSARFDERIAERNRLAGELHDTILQTVQATKMIADQVRDDERAGEAEMRKAIVRMSDWLEQASNEGRAALNALRTSTTQKNDLVEAFRLAADSAQPSPAMRFTLSVTGATKELHPIVRDDVCRIGCEAIRNSCRHSGGTSLEVTVAYMHDLTVRVQDNGRGMDPEIVSEGKPGHFGLRGMRERADRIHGKLRVSSRCGSGTVVELVVPGKAVFRDSGGGSRMRGGRLGSLFRFKPDEPTPPDTNSERQ